MKGDDVTIMVITGDRTAAHRTRTCEQHIPTLNSVPFKLCGYFRRQVIALAGVDPTRLHAPHIQDHHTFVAELR
jgi:hypothetical protein